MCDDDIGKMFQNIADSLKGQLLTPGQLEVITGYFLGMLTGCQVPNSPEERSKWAVQIVTNLINLIHDTLGVTVVILPKGDAPLPADKAASIYS
jgi:hypothetical protein